MKIKKIRIDKNKLLDFFKKLPLLMASHSFSASLILFLLALLIGSVLFYKYFILARKIDFSDLNGDYLLNEEGYEELKKNWQRQETIFEESNYKEYPNPFIESFPFPEVK